MKKINELAWIFTLQSKSMMISIVEKVLGSCVVTVIPLMIKVPSIYGWIFCSGYNKAVSIYV